MSGIGSFLSKGAKPDRVKQFELMSVGKSKEEIRELEMNLLQPEEAVDYAGEVYRYTINDDLAIRIVLQSETELQLVSKYFRVGNYKGKSISNINLLIDMLNCLENGNLMYKPKERSFSVKGD